MIVKLIFLLNLFVLIAAVIQLKQAWSRRLMPVALPLSIYSVVLIIVSTTRILQYFTDYTTDFITTESIIITTSYYVVVLWLWMFAEFTFDRVIKGWIYVLAYPTFVSILFLTNDYHHLYYSNVREIVVYDVPRALYNFGSIRKIHSWIMIAAWNLSIVWAIRQHLRNPRVSNFHFYMIIFLFIFSEVQFFLYDIGVLPFKFASIISLLVLIGATRYYSLLDIVPIARKQIVETFAEGIAILNKKKEIVDRNLKFEEMSGMQIPLKAPFVRLEDLPSYFSPMFDTNGGFTSNGELHIPNDKTFEYRLLPINKNKEISGYSLVIRDITEQAQLAKQKEFYTQQLEQSKLSLERLDQMKSNFFSNVTHEFRTPLTLIQEPARALLQHPENNVRSYAALIRNNSNKLLELVNELLTLTRMDSGKIELNMITGNLTEVIRTEFQKFLPKADNDTISLRLKMQTDFPLISFDKQKIESIVSNLISNAIKYTDNGSINVNLNVSADTAIPQYLIEVGDTGKGISEENLPHIFERFYQVDSTDTRKGEGTGIGLALVRELVQLMNGDISVVSRVGIGSTFTVRLPLILDTQDVNSSIVAATDITETIDRTTDTEISMVDTIISENQGVSENQKIVLIVEDNAELRSFMRNSMQTNFAIIEASNGEEGLSKARTLLPDLIISDVMMPEKDGISLLIDIKSDSLTSHIPVILLTAKSTIEDKLKGLRQGADDYISKPFQLEELIVRSQNVIANRILATEKYIKAQQKNPQNLPQEQDKSHEFIKQFMLIIEEHLDNDTLGVDDYASMLRISRSQLHRKVKSMTNSTTTQFIRDYRLDRAMSMLKGKEGTIKEISMNVGISNSKYFSSTFKAKFGISPSEV